MKNGTILVVDDDREMRVSLTHLLEKGGFAVATASNGRDALDLLRDDLPDAILSDVRMPGMDGLAFQLEVARICHVPVVLFSAHGDIPIAVEAIQNGAYNFVEKPFDPRRLLTLLGNAVRLKRLQDSTARLEQRLSSLTDLERILIGTSPGLVKARQDIHDFSASPANVLITGQTGTGKELVARALHDVGKRPGAPFVAVNCAMIPPDRFEETVFGTAEQPGGLMQRAGGGTLFLDELTSMPMETQSKFIRILDKKTYEPMGHAAPVEMDLRIVSAMAQPADVAVGQGILRQDLMFRLNTLIIELPRLADRGEDIVLLFKHYLGRMSMLYTTAEPQLDAGDISVLLAHDWPGNVRELQSVAERFVLAVRRGPAAVGDAIRGGEDPPEVPHTLREAVAVFERQLIGQAIARHEGRMDDAARQLGIGRRTLNEKIVKLGIEKSDYLSDEAALRKSAEP